MERFGDAMTGGIGPTKNSSSTEMTELIERRSVGTTAPAPVFLWPCPSTYLESDDVTDAAAQIRLTAAFLPVVRSVSVAEFCSARTRDPARGKTASH
jgi:hypothetical protein